MDGAGLVRTLRSVVAPVALPGIAATALICFIFSWNELLFARVLTGDRRADRAGLPHRASSPARACSWPRSARPPFVVSLPVLVAGFAAQDKLVQGLSLGAVKSWRSGDGRAHRGEPGRARPRGGEAHVRPGRRPAGDRALRRGCLPPGAPGHVPGPADERGRGARLGDLRRRRAAVRQPDARRHGGPGLPLHARGEAPGRDVRAAGDRLDRGLPLRAGRPRGGRRADGGRGDAHRLADRDRGRLQHPRRDGRLRRREPGRPARPRTGCGAPDDVRPHHRGARPAARAGGCRPSP